MNDIDYAFKYLKENYSNKDVDGFDLNLLSEFNMGIQDKREVLKMWRRWKSR